MAYPNPSRMSRIRSSRYWHRYLGIFAAVFLVLLTITGLLINHTNELDLSSRFVRSEWLLDHYGINLPEPPRSFQAGARWVSQVGHRLYSDDKFVAETESSMIAAVGTKRYLAIVVEDALFLLSTDGRLVERIGREAGVPAGITIAGVTGSGTLVVRGSDGTYVADDELLQWKLLTDNETVAWAEERDLPGTLKKSLIEDYRGTGLPLERVLLDLHSGRILGAWGIYLFDAAGVIFMVLAMTGVYMFFFPAVSRKKPV